MTRQFTKLQTPSSLYRQIEAAMKHVNAMTPEEREAMYAAQRESWVRGMTARCEHGELDFEQCVQCRDASRSIDGRTVER